MAKYEKQAMEEAEEMEDLKKSPRVFRVPKHLRSDRVSNLPSDTALESNKERQDKEMFGALTSYGKALIPGNLGPTILEQVKKRRDVSGMKKGGKVSSASKRADGIAQRGKTRGKMV